MLRPIDVALTIQHAGDAHRAGLQGSLAGRPEVTAQMYADRLEKQLRQQEQSVAKTPETENVDVNPDGKGHGGGYNPKHKRTKAEEEKAKKKAQDSGESLFDMKV